MIPLFHQPVQTLWVVLHSKPHILIQFESLSSLDSINPSNLHHLTYTLGHVPKIFYFLFFLEDKVLSVQNFEPLTNLWSY
jgi:hypothetical protein